MDILENKCFIETNRFLKIFPYDEYAKNKKMT